MAGGGFTTGSSDVIFEAKITPAVIVSCIMAAFGGLMFGYDIGISGTFILPYSKGFCSDFVFIRSYDIGNLRSNSN